MVKGLLGALTTAFGSLGLYLAREEIGEYVSKYLRGLMNYLADISLKGTMNSPIYEYYFEQIDNLNKQLGANVVTLVALAVGLPLAASAAIYFADRFIEKDIYKD